MSARSVSMLIRRTLRTFGRAREQERERSRRPTSPRNARAAQTGRRRRRGPDVTGPILARRSVRRKKGGPEGPRHARRARVRTRNAPSAAACAGSRARTAVVRESSRSQKWCSAPPLVLMKRLMISNRIMTSLLPPRRLRLLEGHVEFWVLNGVCMRVFVRGALPNVKAGAAVQAAPLNQLSRQLQSGL